MEIRTRSSESEQGAVVDDGQGSEGARLGCPAPVSPSVRHTLVGRQSHEDVTGLHGTSLLLFLSHSLSLSLSLILSLILCPFFLCLYVSVSFNFSFPLFLLSFLSLSLPQSPPFLHQTLSFPFSPSISLTQSLTSMG